MQAINANVEDYFARSKEEAHIPRLQPMVTPTLINSRAAIATAWSHDGSAFAVTLGDHTVRVFPGGYGTSDDPAASAPLAILHGHTAIPFLCAFHPLRADILVTGSPAVAVSSATAATPGSANGGLQPPAAPASASRAQLILWHWPSGCALATGTIRSDSCTTPLCGVWSTCGRALLVGAGNGLYGWPLRALALGLGEAVSSPASDADINIADCCGVSGPDSARLRARSYRSGSEDLLTAAVIRVWALLGGSGSLPVTPTVLPINGLQVPPPVPPVDASRSLAFATHSVPAPLCHLSRSQYRGMRAMRLSPCGRTLYVAVQSRESPPPLEAGVEPPPSPPLHTVLSWSLDVSELLAGVDAYERDARAWAGVASSAGGMGGRQRAVLVHAVGGQTVTPSDSRFGSFAGSLLGPALCAREGERVDSDSMSDACAHAPSLSPSPSTGSLCDLSRGRSRSTLSMPSRGGGAPPYPSPSLCSSSSTAPSSCPQWAPHTPPDRAWLQPVVPTWAAQACAAFQHEVEGQGGSGLGQKRARMSFVEGLEGGEGEDAFTVEDAGDASERAGRTAAALVTGSAPGSDRGVYGGHCPLIGPVLLAEGLVMYHGAGMDIAHVRTEGGGTALALCAVSLYPSVPAAGPYTGGTHVLAPAAWCRAVSRFGSTYAPHRSRAHTHACNSTDVGGGGGGTGSRSGSRSSEASPPPSSPSLPPTPGPAMATPPPPRTWRTWGMGVGVAVSAATGAGISPSAVPNPSPGRTRPSLSFSHPHPTQSPPLTHMTGRKRSVAERDVDRPSSFSDRSAGRSSAPSFVAQGQYDKERSMSSVAALAAAALEGLIDDDDVEVRVGVGSRAHIAGTQVPAGAGAGVVPHVHTGMGQRSLSTGLLPSLLSSRKEMETERAAPILPASACSLLAVSLFQRVAHNEGWAVLPPQPQPTPTISQPHSALLRVLRCELPPPTQAHTFGSPLASVHVADMDATGITAVQASPCGTHVLVGGGAGMSSSPILRVVHLSTGATALNVAASSSQVNTVAWAPACTSGVRVGMCPSPLVHPGFVYGTRRGQVRRFALLETGAHPTPLMDGQQEEPEGEEDTPGSSHGAAGGQAPPRPTSLAAQLAAALAGVRI